MRRPVLSNNIWTSPLQPHWILNEYSIFFFPFWHDRVKHRAQKCVQGCTHLRMDGHFNALQLFHLFAWIYQMVIYQWSLLLLPLLSNGRGKFTNLRFSGFTTAGNLLITHGANERTGKDRYASDTLAGKVFNRYRSWVSKCIAGRENKCVAGIESR